MANLSAALQKAAASSAAFNAASTPAGGGGGMGLGARFRGANKLAGGLTGAAMGGLFLAGKAASGEKLTGADITGVIGSILGGVLGAAFGPVGMMFGSMLGGMAGGGLGSLLSFEKGGAVRIHDGENVVSADIRTSPATQGFAAVVADSVTTNMAAQRQAANDSAAAVAEHLASAMPQGLTGTLTYNDDGTFSAGVSTTMKNQLKPGTGPGKNGPRGRAL